MDSQAHQLKCIAQHMHSHISVSLVLLMNGRPWAHPCETVFSASYGTQRWWALDTETWEEQEYWGKNFIPCFWRLLGNLEHTKVPQKNLGECEWVCSLVSTSMSPGNMTKNMICSRNGQLSCTKQNAGIWKMWNKLHSKQIFSFQTHLVVMRK